MGTGVTGGGGVAGVSAARVGRDQAYLHRKSTGCDSDAVRASGREARLDAQRDAEMEQRRALLRLDRMSRPAVKIAA